MTPREIILAFDSEYDVPLKHNECLGVLMQLGAFEPPDVSTASRDALAVFVGASWCRMVSHDVRYELGESLAFYLASRDVSGRLLDPLKSTQKLDDCFAAYALARWHDGAGKCQYRVSRYREASRLFQEAWDLAKAHDLWWIIPDLCSNALRAHQEAERVAAGGSWGDGTARELPMQIIRNYEQALRDAEEVARDKEIPFASGRLTLPFGEDLPGQHREFLRGCSSLLHNSSVVPWLPAAESLSLSETSAEICRALGDDYRLGQALLQQQMVKRKCPQTLEAARSILEEMQRGKWRRGQQIARQGLAYLEGKDPDKAQSALLKFKNLLEEVDASRRSRGSEFGLDLDFPNYTVVHATEVLKAIPNAASAKMPDGSEWADYLSKERLKNARSLRKVVTIAEDKFTYSAKTVQPAYRPEIGRLVRRRAKALQSGNLEGAKAWADEILSLVEESTSREVLDLMGLNRRLLKSGKSISESFRAEPATKPGLAGAESSERRKSVRKALNHVELDAVRKRAQEYSEELLARPIDVEDVDPDIAHRLRLLAASQPHLCIIRYFLYSDPNKPDLGVLVVMNDWHQVLTGLDYSALTTLRDELVNKAAKDQKNPTPDQSNCRTLYELALAPVFCALVEASQSRPAELVIIPTGCLFELPLHVAWIEDAPLAERFPLVFSVSVNSLLRESRFLLRRQFVAPDDDLCAIIVGDARDDFGHEVAGVAWPENHFFIAGRRPLALVHAHRYWAPGLGANPATWEALQALCAVQPEFFVYSGHGDHSEERKDLPVLLQVETADFEHDYVSELDIAAKVQLRHNKLTVIAACVAGLGVSRREGEVAGFIRSFMAAGCGLLGLSLWPVLATEIEQTTRALLVKALDEMTNREAINREAINFPGELQSYYAQRGQALQALSRNAEARIEACPLLLFL